MTDRINLTELRAETGQRATWRVIQIDRHTLLALFDAAEAANRVIPSDPTLDPAYPEGSLGHEGITKPIQQLRDARARFDFKKENT